MVPRACWPIGWILVSCIGWTEIMKSISQLKQHLPKDYVYRRSLTWFWVLGDVLKTYSHQQGKGRLWNLVPQVWIFSLYRTALSRAVDVSILETSALVSSRKERAVISASLRSEDRHNASYTLSKERRGGYLIRTLHCIWFSQGKQFA